MDDLPAIVPNGTNELTCAVCFATGGGGGSDRGSNMNRCPAVGVCKVCRWYLCRDCVTAHKRHDRFKSHAIAFFYCARKLQVNRQVRATSFCLDCGQYLCAKCFVDHTGYRAYRRHTVIGAGDGDQTPEGHGLGHRWSSPSRDRRRLTTSSARRPTDHDGRKSPYSQLLSISKPYTPTGNATRHGVNRQSLLPGIPRQANAMIDTSRPATAAAAYTATLPRTLISSTVGKRDENQGEPNGDKDQSGKKSKSVHFAQPVRSTTATLQGEFSAQAPKDKQPAKIIAMVYLLDETLVMADLANKTIKHFNKACKYTSCLHLDKLPIAICASETCPRQLYASSGNEIHQIDTENGMTTLQTMVTRIARIEGLTRWEAGIAAIFRSTKSKTDNKGHWEVHLISTEGKVKFIVAISTPLEVRLVSPIWYISSSDSSDEMFISDTHNNRILRIDVINWRVINVIKGKEAGGAPRSITSDAGGAALVVWYGEVRHISGGGADLGVAVKQLGRCAAIAYNPRSRTLAVWADNKAEVNRFKTYHM